MYIIEVEDIYEKHKYYGITYDLNFIQDKIKELIEDSIEFIKINKVYFNKTYYVWVAKSKDKLFIIHFIPAKEY